MGNENHITDVLKGSARRLPEDPELRGEIFKLEMKRAILAREIEGGELKEIVPFREKRKEMVVKTWQEAGEEVLSQLQEEESVLVRSDVEAAKRSLFQSKLIEDLMSLSSRQEVEHLYRLVAFNGDGSKCSKGEMEVRITKINALVDEHQLYSLADLFSLPKMQILSIGKQFAKIVDRPLKDILEAFYDLRKTHLEIEKTKKLVSSDEVVGKMAYGAEQGEEVDFEQLEDEHADLIEEEQAELAALEETRREIEVYLREEEAQLAQTEEELTEVLEEAEVDVQEFGLISSFVEAYLAEGTRFEFKNGHLIFSLTARDGVEVPVRVDGNTLVLKDGEGEIEVPIGDNLRLDREVEVFWVRSVLKKKEQDGEFQIAPEFREFYYSRDLAKFIAAMADVKVEFGDQKLVRELEIEKIYEYVVGLDMFEMFDLQDQIQEANGEAAALRLLAEKRQVEIA